MIPIIERVQVSIRSVPLAGEWQISLYSATEREHAIIEVITDQGVAGLGEASPSPAFMGESARTIALVIEEYLGPAIVGLPVDALAGIHAAMDGAIHAQTAAKSAIDIAVHDAWGQGLGRPVYSLLGGRCRDTVPLCYVVGIKADEAVAEERLFSVNPAEVVGAYLMPVSLTDGAPSPVHFREAFRTRGPSNRFHGKQAEGY